MDPAAAGLRVATTLVAPLIKQLFQKSEPGAGLVDQAVRLSALVSFRGEKRTLSHGDLRKLTEKLVGRAQRAVGPHDKFPHGEQASVVDAVVRTLYGLGELDMDDMQAVRLGPERFAQRLRAEVPDACRELSVDGTSFHDRLVDSASVHILDFFTQRSTFIARTLVEQSRRLDEILDDLRKLSAPDADDVEFEEQYAAGLVRQHGQLTIVGVDFMNSPDNWSLDATYLSLDVEPSDEDAGGVQDSQLPVPVDRALAGQERVLLRGMAGSGKTTLVQRLAVSTANGRLPVELDRLRGRVPFVLPVRRFSDQGLPTPARFLSAVHHPMADAEPKGWAVRVLESGRGLLLVDGIDEAPAERRESIRRELDELLRMFPGNSWLVTSRSHSVSANWLSGQGFTELSLAPMNREQVSRFIRSWHAAAVTDRGFDHDRLPAYERELLHSVGVVREIRRLATNPLMCGLICALNRDRGGILPKSRKRLYNDALAMLLERRDPEREVAPDPVVLDQDDKEGLLQKLAHWMLRNDRSEMSWTTAVDTLELHRRANPRAAEYTAEQLFDHLLHRTGLLRRPAPDTVEFVHRTFQDYLSAKEAVQQHDIPLLNDNAHRGDWDGVISAAISLARPDERANMIDNLISARPELSAAEAKYCKLLAVSCLEHATEMSVETRDRVRKETRFLAQPNNMATARALGWIGPIALELLPNPEQLSDRRALLLAAAASAVRDEAAIDYLARLRTHRSLEIRNELAGAWQRFDTERYAREIIAHLDPEDLDFPITNRGELAALRRLGGRERIKVTNTDQLTPEELVDGLVARRVTRLYLMAYDAQRSLDWLHAFPQLSTLRLGPQVGAVHGVPDGIQVERDS